MFIIKKRYVVFFDEPSVTDPKTPDPKTPPVDPKTPDQKFTPDQEKAIEERINKIKAEYDDKIKKSFTDLETFRQKSTLTAQQKEELEKQLELTRGEFLTKEELAKKEAKKNQDKFDKDLKSLTEERDSWKKRYSDQTIDSELISAATKYNAFNPEQIVRMLKPMSQLVEELDKDQKATGKLIVKTSWTTKDDKGNTVPVLLPPDEVLKVISSSEEWFNLFKDKGIKGVGKGSSVTNKDLSSFTNDVGAYIEAREKGLIKL